MFQEGQIIYFTPFYFKNGNTAKNKYFVVLKYENNQRILAALPTRKDFIPVKNTPEQGCVELPEINLNCFVFAPNKPLTICNKYFKFPTHIYGHTLDIYEIKFLNNIYKIEHSDYEIWGKMKSEIFFELLNCLRSSKIVKRKYKKMLSDFSIP